MRQQSGRLSESHFVIHPLQFEKSIDFAAAVSLALSAGGDRRIWPAAETGRNKYGTTTRPAPDEISFASTTASNVSILGFAAANHKLKRLFDSGSQSATDAEAWFDDIRQSIVRHLGREGAEVIFAASGTDVELLTLCLTAALTRRPITNIFIAPDETGNGVPLAAGGLHFSDVTALGIPVKAGEGVTGLAPDQIHVRAVAIRRENGERRSQHEIDVELIDAVQEELEADRDVLVHVLDTSKTGLRGVTRHAARYLAGLKPGRVRIVIDACQLRSPISDLREYLADGFFVAVTGSKFAAGPPFAGALLIPFDIVQEIGAGADLPPGLADYSAALDWPASLRDRIVLPFKSEMNIGLGLRWVAALAHIAPYAAVSETRQTLIKQRFVSLVKNRVADIPGVELHSDDDGENLVSSAILPLTVLDADGRYLPLAEAQRIQSALRNSLQGPVCHVGQPVSVGPRSVLRVAASAYDVGCISARMNEGKSFDQALAPLIADLDSFFAKWSLLGSGA